MTDMADRQEGISPARGAVPFEDLYRRYVRPIYAFVAWRVPDRTTAEDVTSQVFEKAWRRFSTFDPARGGAAAWIFTIARNCLADHYRRQGRVRETSIEEVFHAPDTHEPQDGIVAEDTSRELLDAVRSLKPSEQEIVALKFGAAMTNRDIGRLLGKSESNVGTILYRSLRKLKELLEDGVSNE